MTPLDYAKKYWDMEVPFEDGPVIVKVKSYLSGCHSSPIVAKAQELIDQVGESLTIHIRTVFGNLEKRVFDKTSRRVLNGIIKDPFNGKGSPEEIQALLQVAVKAGALKKEELPQFCLSGKIGLDCCGFVSNYVWHAVMRKPWDIDVGNKDLAASNYIPAMMAAGKAIKTEADFVANKARCLVLATADENGKVIVNGPGAHVMITEPNSLISMSRTTQLVSTKSKSTFEFQGSTFKGTQSSTSNQTFVVVESTGGGKGLVSSRYSLLSVNEKTGLFKVKRGCSNGTLNVRFATIVGG